MTQSRYRIEGVVVTRPEGSHDDERRTIVVITNNLPGDIYAGQIKALVLKQDAWLGGQKGHYHEYPEMYAALAGKLMFYLQDIGHPEFRQKVTVEPGERLTIPAGVAHKVWAPNGAIFVGVTEQPYDGPSQDHPFPVTTSDDDI